MMELEKMSLDALKDYAASLSKKYSVPFKKSVQGKNKKELLKFITETESKHGNQDRPLSSNNNINPDLQSKTKKELLDIARSLPGFQPVFEKKTRPFLMEFIQKNEPDHKEQEKEQEDSGTISPIHLDDFLDNPDPEKIRQAIIKCFSEKPFDQETYLQIQKNLFT